MKQRQPEERQPDLGGSAQLDRGDDGAGFGSACGRRSQWREFPVAAERRRALRAGGVARVFTPRDFAIADVLGQVVDAIEEARGLRAAEH